MENENIKDNQATENATQNDNSRYTHRLLARIVVEAASPLAIGSGKYDAFTDALVAKDANDLPYIPGTAMAGVLRSMMEAEDKDFPLDDIFGYQKGKNGKGSEIIFTEAKIINSNGEVVDGLNPLAISSDPLLAAYKDLPVRQHVRLSHKGVVDGAGKFDEQVVFPGTCFCFEVEMVAKNEDLEPLKNVLRKLSGNNFRIGGGTRKGFGELKVKDISMLSLDLTDPADRKIYLDKTSALDPEFWDTNKSKCETMEEAQYSLTSFIPKGRTIQPEDFFMFGSGFGDEEVDGVPVKASKVTWTETEGKVTGKMEHNLVLMPATSIKGALSHRVAFHWNSMNHIFADDLIDEKTFNHAAAHNEAVEALFGSVNGNVATRGNVFISDIIKKVKYVDKVFNHVAIDRFTGGSLQGALFSEKANYTPGEVYDLDIYLDGEGLKKSIGNDMDKYKKIVKALDLAIDDICSGMLPLGGRVNKGYGNFTMKNE